MAVLSASILDCDTAFIGKTVMEAERGGVDQIHVDVMDGVYVANLSFGPKNVRDIKKILGDQVKVDVHFELLYPERYVDMFAEAGADVMTFQLGSCFHPVRLLDQIRSHGVQAGVAINPADSWEGVKYLVDHMDHVLMMSMEPGFSGQEFEESVYAKTGELQQYLQSTGRDVMIGIDGAVNAERAEKFKKLGVEYYVVGNAIFGSGEVGDNIKA
ncbi:MAG: ribulose-phosphate 3-epimerase, partial [Christensenella sp.]|uniref:ribulose-phosphate 3-epimerase n=1 Tax=Christensenella sp. TaxID=1935934 RepID=UPI002B1F98D0